MIALAERVRAGDARALARAISVAEEDEPHALALLRALYPHTGRATVVGLTGAPGAGKSSLVDRLIRVYRESGRRVGIVAVDPSSAFSGGAILGDRVRMQAHAADAGVFIRSMATRGQLGGLARATNDAIDLMDAAGYDPVLVETVGVGQDEVDIVRTADVVAVVLVPGMGDDIQTIKAGILEIADLFVINKADRDGADRLEADLGFMLSLQPASSPRPSIVRTVAVTGEGVAALAAAADASVALAPPARRAARRRERAESRLLTLLGGRLVRHVVERAFAERGFAGVVDAIAERTLDPYTAVQDVLSRLEFR